jgi:tetratricopeptide (TPR) repeat protein
LLQATNRLGEAEPLMRRALAINKRSFGPEHPDVSATLNNLAMLLQAANRLVEAEPLMRDMNRPAEAEPLIRRALLIFEQSLGPEHPNVAITLHNLGQSLQDTNRLTEAEPLMRRGEEILVHFQRLAGYPHPQLETACRHYETLLQKMGRTQAEIEQDLKEIVTGPHP